MNLVSLTEGIATRLDTIAGLQCFAYTPLSVTPPSAFVGFADVTYDRGTSVGQGWEARVYVVAGRADDRTAWKALSPFMDDSGSSSVRAALEGDPTLAGAARWSRLVRSSVTPLTMSGVDYLAVVLELEGAA